MKKIRLKDVKEAERNYASVYFYSTNPIRDLAVSRTLERWNKLKEQWEEQKRKEKVK